MQSCVAVASKTTLQVGVRFASFLYKTTSEYCACVCLQALLPHRVAQRAHEAALRRKNNPSPVRRILVPAARGHHHAPMRMFPSGLCHGQ
jgi:hypothetical protein